MDTSNAHLVFKIERVDKGEDGFLYVEGYGATTRPVPFSDPRLPGVKFLRFTKAFLDKAMPAYMARVPKVRIMHSPKLGSGGKTLEYRVDDGGVWVRIRVSHNAQADVEDEFYTELSIGAQVTRSTPPDSTRTANALDGKISEFSIVDEGKDSGCPFTISRAEGDDEVVEMTIEEARAAAEVQRPSDVDDCVAAMEGRPGVGNAYALCNWMKKTGKGYFAVDRAAGPLADDEVKRLAGDFAAAGEEDMGRHAIGVQLKRVAEAVQAAGKTRDLATVVERGMGSVNNILCAFEYLSSARAMELYEEATKGGAGGQSEKFLNAMMATAELAVAHLIEEFMEVFGGAAAMAENAATADNEKRAADLAAPILRAAEMVGDKALFTATYVKRFDDLADGLKVVRAKEEKKAKEDEEEKSSGPSFHEEMAVHHAGASKIHADYAKDEKDEKAKGYHEGMAAHHAAVSATYLNEHKRGSSVERVEGAVELAADPVLVDRVSGVETRLAASDKAMKDHQAFVDGAKALLKPLEGLDVTALVNRVAATEKANSESKARIEAVDKILRNTRGVRQTSGTVPVERAAVDVERSAHVDQCARLQVKYQAALHSKDSAEKGEAKDGIEVMRVARLYDERLKDCRNWEDVEKIRASAAA